MSLKIINTFYRNLTNKPPPKDIFQFAICLKPFLINCKT